MKAANKMTAATLVCIAEEILPVVLHRQCCIFCLLPRYRLQSMNSCYCQWALSAPLSMIAVLLEEQMLLINQTNNGELILLGVNIGCMTKPIFTKTVGKMCRTVVNRTTCQ